MSARSPMRLEHPGPGAPATVEPRRPRSDSLRNRQRVLEAAERVLGSEGLSAPIDRVAEEAGVGVGTIYRHFPTKEALFEAILLSHFEHLVKEARLLAEAKDAASGLFALLDRLLAYALDKRDLADALSGAGVDIKASAGGLKRELEEIGEGLLARAQQEGTVRADISAADLICLVAGTCGTAGSAGSSGASPAKMLDIMRAGMLRKD
ncbi:MAG: TetR/AcrR family transcriptional regulator [Acidimicrobiales bacterium]